MSTHYYLSRSSSLLDVGRGTTDFFGSRLGFSLLFIPGFAVFNLLQTENAFQFFDNPLLFFVLNNNLLVPPTSVFSHAFRRPRLPNPRAAVR